MKPAVLVTDGEQRGALATTRSLGRAGYRVYVCAKERATLATVSRFATDRAVVADALTSPDRFVDDIESLVRRWGIRVVIPITDPALDALLPARDRLQGATIPFASAESYGSLSDKATATEAAREVGIAVPRQIHVPRREDLRAAAAALKYPLILKPSRSVRVIDGRVAKLDVGHAADEGQLRAHERRLDEAAFPLLLQERIVGPGLGVFLLTWDGRTLAKFSHRRLREKPPGGGMGVYAVSVPIDPVLLERCEALFRRFDWRGPAMVELKLDSSTGEPYFIEVNARFWASLQLAIDAGVDFPTLLVRAALGEQPTPVLDYRLGVRLRWWWGDVDHMITRMIRSRRRLSLPPDAPNRLSVLGSFVVATLREGINEVYRSDDPRPFVQETIDWFRRR